MKKTTILVMFIAILSKLLGFARDITLSSVLGINVTTDAFQAAISIPSTVLSVVGAALVSGIIPMLTRISKEDETRANNFTSNVMNIMLLAAAVLSIFMFVVPELVVKMIVWNMDAETLAIAASFVRIISFGTFSVSIVQLGTGYLNVMKSFLIPAFIGIPANFIIISAILLSSRTNKPVLMAYGQLIALLLQALITIFTMKKLGYKYRPIINLKDEDLRLMVYLALPLVISSTLGQVNGIVMKGYATKVHGDAGAYSYMVNADKLIAFVQGVFTTSILSVSYPTITRAVVSKDNSEINKSISEAILMLVLLILPAMVGFVVLSREIVSFVYFRGKVTLADIDVLVPMFLFNSTVLLSHAIRELFYRISYAYQDMISPVKNTALFSIFFMTTMVFFANVFGNFGMPLAGLTFAFSISTFLTIIPMWFSLKKRHLKYLDIHNVLPDLSKMAISSVIMSVVILVTKNFFGSNTSSLFIVIILAVITYGGSLLLLRTEFVLSLIKK